MANLTPQIDLDNETLAELLAKATTDASGTYSDVLQTLKIDDPGNEAAAVQIKEVYGQLLGNIRDDFLQAAYPKLYKQTKAWDAADPTARDALGSDDGLVVNDVAWVRSVRQFWYADTVVGPGSSTWTQVASGGGGGGGAVGLRYNLDVGTADADPGAGKFRFDNATQSLASFVYVNEDTVDGGGLARTFREFGNNTRLRLQQEDTPGNNKIYTLTATPTLATGYTKIPLTPSSQDNQGSDLVVGQDITWEFYNGGGLDRILGRSPNTGGHDIIVDINDGISGDPVILYNTGADTEPIIQVESRGTNAGSFRWRAGDRDPNGAVTGNPGDMYRQVSLEESKTWSHVGTVSNNTDWVVSDSGGQNSLSGEWKFNTAVSGDPGTGRFRFDNATQASALKIAISKTTDGGVDAGGLLLNLIDATFHSYIQQKDTSANNISVDFTSVPNDLTTYVEYDLTVTASGSPIVNNKISIIWFLTDASVTPPQNLDEVLTQGNTTTGNDIIVSVGDKLTAAGELNIDTTAAAADIRITAKDGVIINSTENNLVLGAGDAHLTNTTGHGISAIAGDGDGTGVGGSWIGEGGKGGATAMGGAAVLRAGRGGTTSGNGGEVFLEGGDAFAEGNGGNAAINAGNAVGTDKNGGNVLLVPTAKTGTGVDGTARVGSETIVTTVTNTGTGDANIMKAKGIGTINGADVDARRLSGSGGIVVTENAEDIDINGAGVTATIPSIQISRTTTFTVTGTPAGFAFNSEDGGGFDAAVYTWVSGNNDVTIDVTGTYLIQAECGCASTNSGDNTDVNLELYHEGAVMTDRAIGMSSHQGQFNAWHDSSVVSVVRDLAATDIIGPRVYVHSGDNLSTELHTMRFRLTKLG